MKIALMSLLVIGILVMGCTQTPPAATPSPTSMPTATPVVTVPVQTATPEPTATPTESPTVEPSPTATLRAVCFFDSDCGPQETCNIGLGTCERLGATPLPTTSPSPTPALNLTARMMDVVGNLEDLGNPILANLSDSYSDFRLTPSQYDVSGTRPLEYSVQHLLSATVSVSGIPGSYNAYFGAQVRFAAKGDSDESRKSATLDGRSYYYDLYSDLVPGKFANGNSSMFYCYSNSMRVMTFMPVAPNTRAMIDECFRMK